MPNSLNATFPPSLELGDDPNFGNLRRGRRPVIFDVLGPNRVTSLLPQGIKLVLNINPKSMSFSYAKQTNRTQTRGGFVELHWGDAAEEVTFSAATGGFMRLYSGLSNIAGGAGDQGRRQTIAYDKYLDLLALFHNNGAIFDRLGNIVQQGYIKMSFDGGVHIGWFDGQFSVTEAAEKPYMFEMSARFIIDHEILSWRSSELGSRGTTFGDAPASVFDAQAVQQKAQEPGDTATEILNQQLRDPSVDPYLSAEAILAQSEHEFGFFGDPNGAFGIPKR